MDTKRRISKKRASKTSRKSGLDIFLDIELERSELGGNIHTDHSDFSGNINTDQNLGNQITKDEKFGESVGSTNQKSSRSEIQTEICNQKITEQKSSIVDSQRVVSECKSYQSGRNSADGNLSPR